MNVKYAVVRRNIYVLSVLLHIVNDMRSVSIKI